MLNSNTTFTCGYSGTEAAISWWADGVTITSGGTAKDSDKHAVNWDPAAGKYDLTIMNTQDTDAVQYYCNLQFSEKEAFAELVVFGELKV